MYNRQQTFTMSGFDKFAAERAISKAGIFPKTEDSNPFAITPLRAYRRYNSGDDEFVKSMMQLIEHPDKKQEILDNMSIRALAVYNLRMRGERDSDPEVYYHEVHALEERYPTRDRDIMLKQMSM